MGLLGNVANVAYVLLLVGGLNWLTTGMRLLVDNAGDDKMVDSVPDLLSWMGETVQIAVYLAVGASSLFLLSVSILGIWVREDGLCLCV